MIRILYVEDDTTLCQLFEVVMAPRGYAVDVATTGAEGLSKHKSNPYDIVALDYQLPDMTGLDIAKEILETDPNLPVLMITGRGNEGIAAEALRLGVSNYIVKDSQESYVDLLPSVILHLERRLEIESIMRKSAEALKESQEQSKQQFLTQLDTAERYEHQARELASLAEELTVANERLTAFANHDELTGLPNSRLCKDRLKVAIATARRSDAEVAFIHVDFDNFKTINTKVGRPGGDAILREIASRLQKCVRDMDTASRLRSDRFGLVVAGIDDRDTVVTVAKRLQASLAAPYEFDGETVPVGTQIGMAIYPEHGSTAEELLSHAELSVHNAEIYGSDADGADAA
tara:strand:- start:368 stop:1405 length:1038 start_codon:yes stop_codon:yes gene_type:complete